MFRNFLHLPAIFFAVACVVNVGGPAGALVPDEPSTASNGTSEVGVYLDFQIPALQFSQRGEGKKRRSGGRKKKTNAGSVATDHVPCTECEDLKGFVSPSEIDDKIRKMVGKYKGGGGSENVAIQQARGVIETGLYPEFIGGADCPEIDSEKWAIDYSFKRGGRAALHKGVDIPQSRDTPIRAVAGGVVVGRFMNKGNRKGIEVMLRHTPEQTGLPFWTYSQYTHLREMSPLLIGAHVEMGQEIGKTSNTGKMGRRIRRDALHLAIVYSERPEWSNDGRVVTPKEGHFMDPNAFYKLKPPYDSQSLATLPEDQKRVPVPYMKTDGSFVPMDTKRIWPYPCE
jgi:murein DD-endopeptidase MepM/ murein hydrolase activator NlpD